MPARGLAAGGDLAFRPPHCGLLPDRFRLPLVRPAARAHAALHRYSYRFRLTETLFELTANGHVKATFSRELMPGGVIGSEDADIHQISNLQLGDADLVTLHVYSPPLLWMGTYSLTDRTRGQEAMFVEFRDAAGI